MTSRDFSSPFDVEPPDGDIEGWEEMYPYSVRFSEGRREYEEGRFWFQDAMHWGWALTPWDSTHVEQAAASLSQYNTRHFCIPPSDGIDVRILYGYPYFSPITIDDPARIEERVGPFVERAGHYFEHWDELYSTWMKKVRANIAEIDEIDFSPLPDVEPVEAVRAASGVGSGWRLQEQYHRFKDLCLRTWQYHFEFLNLGYTAYLDFFVFCRGQWPSMPDQSIAKMVAGIDVDLFRPNEKLKELARLAIELGLARLFDDPGDVAAIDHALATRSGGDAWRAAWDAAADPWFNFTTGTGYYHYDEFWIDHPEIPYTLIRDHIAKIEAGHDLRRPLEQVIAERDRAVEGYAELLPSDEHRTVFHRKLDVARMVFPYVEDHNFYIEHWTLSRFWRKLRELGGVLADAGFIDDAGDVVYFRRDEIDEALWDLYAGWAGNVPAAGPSYWPPRIERRKRILDRFRAWRAPRALGPPPETIADPFTIMLWGITSDTMRTWTGGAEHPLTGMGASSGCVEGVARLVFDPQDLDEVRDGEILVAPTTAPSWATVFPRIAACVTDTGGTMSHAAIVCREYGVPAVTGTIHATEQIATGQRIRVDGSAGTVELIG